MISELKGLVAYPSTPPDISKTIGRCLSELHTSGDFNYLESWEESDIPGRFFATEVYTKIESGTIFIADITKLNFNVVFEIGYAIGSKKRAFLIRNKAIIPDVSLIRQIGIFDTLGYKDYSDYKSLSSIIIGINDLAPIRFDENSINQKTPVYILLPPVKTDTETHLISRVKKARLSYRSFDPIEQGRLSAPEAIENVACSHGVVVTLLPYHFGDAIVHNIRAAFLAGLSLGMNRITLILQAGGNPIPLDYRDLVKSFSSLERIDEHVAEFATTIFGLLQSRKPALIRESSTFLAKLVLGASAAENEFQELGNYYLETDEFRRAIRGEVQIVLGRKGAGKSAMFFQLRDRVRNNKKNVVLDLKPEGFQLIKFKEQVLDYLSEGTREHTITAFWEYLILLEVCHKLLKNDQIFYMRDSRLFKSYQTLADIYSKDEYVSEGDFSERMLRLTQRIIEDFHVNIKDPKDRLKLNNEEVTGYIYKHNISHLRQKLVDYLKNKEALWILFDNLDKGWPPHGLKPEDVLSLRCLIDAINKFERAFRRENIPTFGLLFIRNDVFENLVSITSDRGKISSAFVDWTDPALLLELLRLRFVSSGAEESATFDNIWNKICVSHLPSGEETSYYMVDRSLMRPRSLIDLVRFCRSHAVNLKHSRIEVEDIENGEEQYSTQLVNDITYEIQDIFPLAKDILYEFIECPSEISVKVLESILSKVSSNESVREKILDLLLWYGVLGFRRLTGEPTYIYSVRYDVKRLKALLNKHEEEAFVYTINPAFWSGLEIKKR